MQYPHLGSSSNSVQVRCVALDSKKMLRSTETQFRGGLAFKVDGLMYHSTLGLRVMQKNKK